MSKRKRDLWIAILLVVAVLVFAAMECEGTDDEKGVLWQAENGALTSDRTPAPTPGGVPYCPPVQVP